MEIFNFIWVAFIAVTTLNAFVLKYRSQKYIKGKPELEPGYNQLVKGIIFYGNIPWVIVGMGNLFRYTSNLTDYLYIKSLNPFIILFYVSVFILWLLGIRWIYFKKGAEFLEEHPGLVVVKGAGDPEIVSAKKIKLFFGLISLSNLIFFSFLLFQFNQT